MIPRWQQAGAGAEQGATVRGRQPLQAVMRRLCGQAVCCSMGAPGEVVLLDVEQAKERPRRDSNPGLPRTVMWMTGGDTHRLYYRDKPGDRWNLDDRRAGKTASDSSIQPPTSGTLDTISPGKPLQDTNTPHTLPHSHLQLTAQLNQGEPA